MSTVIFQSPVKAANRRGDTLQLIITFTDASDTLIGTFNMDDYGILVTSWGEASWDYDLEDNLLVPGSYRCELSDKNGTLRNYFYGITAPYTSVAKRATVELKLNGETEIFGTLQEDGIKYSVGSRSVSLNVDPKTQILTETKLFRDDPDLGQSEYYNPLGLTRGGSLRIHEILEKIYRLVDASISYDAGSLVIYHDWLFWGERYDGRVKVDIPFVNILQLVDPLFFDKSKGVTTIADVLKKLSIDWCCMTGLIHQKKAFMKKLFIYNEGNTQALGTVLDKILWYKYGLIDYVEVKTTANRTLRYKQGKETNIQGRSLRRDTLPSFYSGQLDPMNGTMTAKATNVYATVFPPDAYSGAYNIYGVRDPAYPTIGKAENGWVDNGELLSKIWYDKRSNLVNTRVDEIYVVGIHYDFLKDFTDEGLQYQPIGMKKNYAENTTKFNALMLGAS